MPWESATPKKKKSMNSVTSPIPASPTRADAKSRSISVRALKSKTPAHYASGVQDHTARIRKARQAKEAREREMALMGHSADYAKSLRMDKPKIASDKGSSSEKKRRGRKHNLEVLMTPRVKMDKKTETPEAPATEPSGINIPPALRMRVQMDTGESQMLEIYAGDSPADIARNFSERHGLERSKETKLSKLIAANMAKHNIPMK